MSDAVIVAIIGGVVSMGSLAMTLLIKKGQDNLHKQINGRMGELLDATKAANRAEGEIVGKEKAEAKAEIKADAIKAEAKIEEEKKHQ